MWLLKKLDTSTWTYRLCKDKGVWFIVLPIYSNSSHFIFFFETHFWIGSDLGQFACLGLHIFSSVKAIGLQRSFTTKRQLSRSDTFVEIRNLIYDQVSPSSTIHNVDFTTLIYFRNKVDYKTMEERDESSSRRQPKPFF